MFGQLYVVFLIFQYDKRRQYTYIYSWNFISHEEHNAIEVHTEEAIEAQNHKPTALIKEKYTNYNDLIDLKYMEH
ncbi:hypothetical protein [Aquibacillus sediminis]|uniref:hypothetical protein n=1 Tax=Aquibacillus sediminis TaxID=2574734 RepID=UPI001108FDA2|nr:hypothetical protein [Aquibacillus sediminis]